MMARTPVGVVNRVVGEGRPATPKPGKLAQRTEAAQRAREHRTVHWLELLVRTTPEREATLALKL